MTNFQNQHVIVTIGIGRDTDGGSLVFNTSTVNDMGMPESGVHSGTTGAIRSAIYVFANELAARQIRVNAVSPGAIDSGFFGATGLGPAEIEVFSGQVLAQVPLELASESSLVTSHELVADGGIS